jgi:hypothetical protein
LAIFPLAEILSYSTEELSASMGQIIGGLINATFGNAVEMIVSRPTLVMEGLLTDPQVGNDWQYPVGYATGMASTPVLLRVTLLMALRFLEPVSSLVVCGTQS